MSQLHHVLDMEERSAAAAKRTFYIPSSGTTDMIPPPPGFSATHSGSLWIPKEEDECQFKCCHNCRPTCEARSYLSVDGILKDDIPATAAVGFGFHLLGSRPVINADIVKNIGSRQRFQVYMPTRTRRNQDNTLIPQQPQPSRKVSDTPVSSPSSRLNVQRSIDQQIANFARLDTNKNNNNREMSSQELQHAPNFVRAQLNGRVLRDNSASDWKTANQDMNGIVKFNSHPATDLEDLPFSTLTHMRACLTPLPASTPHEDAFFHEQPTRMEEEEMEEQRFYEEPLELADGVAVLEESVEMHVPDVITQF
jgi:hypothetical protein